MRDGYDLPHYVYRCYGADGRLLYVGCTRNLVGRLAAHDATFWAYEVVKVKAKVYPGKWAGLEAEAGAIRTERPRYNVKGRWATRHNWTLEDCEDYRRAVLACADTGHRVAHLARIDILRIALTTRENAA